jgi:hypothetical protein
MSAFHTADQIRKLWPAEWRSTVILRSSNSEDCMSHLGQKQTLRRPITMSALPPKADIAERPVDVCFVPKADIDHLHSITSLARADMAGDTSTPRVLAVFKFRMISNRVACSIGKSAGFRPFKILSTNAPAPRQICGKSTP